MRANGLFAGREFASGGYGSETSAASSRAARNSSPSAFQTSRRRNHLCVSTWPSTIGVPTTVFDAQPGLLQRKSSARTVRTPAGSVESDRRRTSTRAT